MAIKSSQSNGRQYVYLDLQNNCTKHLSAERLAKRAGQGEPGFRYKEDGEVKLTRALTGHIASARLGEDSYEGVTYPIATFKLVDEDAIDEVVRVRLDNSLGRRMVGLAVASVMAGEPPVDLWVSQIRQGEKFSDGTIASKDMTFLNAKDLAAEERLNPVFLSEAGDPLTFKGQDGKDKDLPEGKKLKVNGKEVWDFSEHIDIAKTAVRHLEAHFKEKETATHTQGQDHGEGDGNGIDMSEAAAAAAAPKA